MFWLNFYNPILIVMKQKLQKQKIQKNGPQKTKTNKNKIFKSGNMLLQIKQPPSEKKLKLTKFNKKLTMKSKLPIVKLQKQL